MSFIGKMIDIEQRDLKKSFRKEGFFSKIGGLMALCETMKKHKLLKEPTFCETFFNIPSAQYQSSCLKTSFLQVFSMMVVFKAVDLISDI